MSFKFTAMILLFAAVAFSAAACCEKGGADPQVAELHSRIAALEAANKALEAQLAEPKPAASDCSAELAACKERAAKCEKDPFTGPKYLTDEPGQKPAQ
jgi:septal ring factor EnvC (AmiA/AmiB activator)